MKNMIDITGVDLKAFVKKVYDLSVPQGYGFLHYQEGELTDEEAKTLLAYDNGRIAVDMDYIKGRACKMVVFKEGEKLLIQDVWYGHTDEQFKELLLATLSKDRIEHIGRKHNMACNCVDCQRKNSRM